MRARTRQCLGPLGTAGRRVASREDHPVSIELECGNLGGGQTTMSRADGIALLRLPTCIARSPLYCLFSVDRALARISG